MNITKETLAFSALKNLNFLDLESVNYKDCIITFKDEKWLVIEEDDIYYHLEKHANKLIDEIIETKKDIYSNYFNRENFIEDYCNDRINDNRRYLATYDNVEHTIDLTFEDEELEFYLYRLK
jgi:hypothetical protein